MQLKKKKNKIFNAKSAKDFLQNLFINVKFAKLDVDLALRTFLFIKLFKKNLCALCVKIYRLESKINT